MEIRNNLDAVRSLFGVEGSSSPAIANKKASLASTGTGLNLDADQATLSTAGSEVSSSMQEGEVRFDKVAAIQSAIVSGSYDVPASAVAAKLVDSMLGKGD